MLALKPYSRIYFWYKWYVKSLNLDIYLPLHSYDDHNYLVHANPKIEIELVTAHQTEESDPEICDSLLNSPPAN